MFGMIRWARGHGSLPVTKSFTISTTTRASVTGLPTCYGALGIKVAPAAGRFITRRVFQHCGGAVKLLPGSASVGLAKELAKALRGEFVEVAYEKHPGGFPDGERYVRVLGSLEGEHAVVVQTTHPDPKIVELLLLLDAVRDLKPKRVTLVVPYF